MASGPEPSHNGFDTVKLVTAIMVLIGGIAAFYYFAAEPLVYRVLGVLTAVIGSFSLILMTTIGKGFLSFLKESRVEVRKIVWPTRQETTQSTLIVVALVFTMGLILWAVDSLLFWGVNSLTGQGN